MEIDLRDLLAMFWHRIWLIMLATLLGGAAALLITYFGVTPMYTASVSMYVSNNENRTNAEITTSDLSASQGLVDTYIVVLKSDTLLTKVSKQLPPEYQYQPNDLRKMMSASSIDGTEAFKISVENASPEAAQTIVNTIAQVAPDEIIRVVKAGEVAVIDYASLPDKADWPLMRNTLIGLLLGLLLSMAGIVLYNILDVTVHTAEDLLNHYELPVLGEIPNIVPQGIESERKREYIDEKVEA